jgi:uncharacterized protein (TIGR03437 family)
MIDGKPAYVYYVSPTQINVLSPADTAQGSVPVQVTYAGKTSNTLNATQETYAPALFTLSPLGQKYVAATHADGSYVGPTNLYPGLTTPVQPGETIVLYGTGFGPTTPSTNVGQTFSGAPLIPIPPSATIGGFFATVLWAGLVAPGEYQFNIVVPYGPQSGDNPVLLTVFGGPSSQPNAYLTVQ